MKNSATNSVNFAVNFNQKQSISKILMLFLLFFIAFNANSQCLQFKFGALAAGETQPAGSGSTGCPVNNPIVNSPQWKSNNTPVSMPCPGGAPSCPSSAASVIFYGGSGYYRFSNFIHSDVSNTYTIQNVGTPSALLFDGSPGDGSVNSIDATNSFLSLCGFGYPVSLPMGATSGTVQQEWKTITCKIAGAVIPDGDANKLTITVGYTVTSTVLPLEWVYFAASPNYTDGSSKVELFWEIAGAKNVDNFAVERSNDGKTFTKIGLPISAKNASEKKNFDAIDHKPLLGIAYYRIKETDFDGRTIYTTVQSVNVVNPKAKQAKFLLSPNPISKSGPLSISTESEELYTLQVMDLMGRVVYNKPLSGSVEVSDLSLAAGMYVYRILSNEQNVTGKFLVAN